MIDIGFCDCLEDYDYVVMCRVHGYELLENNQLSCEDCRISMFISDILSESPVI